MLQSILARSSPPTCHLLGVLAIIGLVGALPAQRPASVGRVTAAADFVKEPGGVVLARLASGTRLAMGTIRGSSQEVTLDGWIPASALRADRRDGFDLAVNLAAGAPIRAGADSGATLGSARVGALFTKVGERKGWVHVRRTGWVARNLLAAANTATTPTRAPTAKPDSAARSGAVDSLGWATIPGGTSLAAQPGGPPVGSLESPLRGEVIEQRGGWAKVRLEAWVRSGALGSAPPPDRITAEEVRSQPERFIGQTVEWTLQVLAVQKADELRPELPLGQPYVLTRGPLPETGFVYLVVEGAEVERFRALEPLAEVRVRATVRAGKTRFLPTPVLDFLRRLD
ncbi:MAG: hypothetical protein SFU57_02920 [Gemmatimonadales bacterium]|nr:hypothetical protein [Gemmatimonadales bacterium]